MADYEYVEPTGVILPDTSGLLTDVQSEYQAVFGADLVVTPDTPQGVLITAETLARTEVVNNNAAVANQINPNVAGGVFLDALMALTGMQRTVATPTVVTNVSLTGVSGTVIPAGSLAATSAGDQFQSVSTVTLVSGTATVNFQSVATGPIPCAGSALTTIVSAVLGWETVTNNPSGTPASATTLGTVTQSDQAARALRQNTLAFQGVSLAEAITSALYNVQGVTSLTFQENVSASTQTINGISMVGHSIYACIEGGTDTAVAAALLENKSSGCAWNGGTSVSVVEPASGQSYTVLFDRPTQVGILVKVTTTNGNEANIIQAILDYAAGNINGLAGFVVGASVSPFEIAGAIMSEFPGYYISQVEISLTSPVSYTTSVIAIGVNEIAQTQASYVSVIIA
ncbi:baseplate J/gp47 family protein [Fimbriiglobus ruber]|uniref:Putative bacteriophage protein n=1 Tax=Fimbriiglobus ruber TaxID=1908690 RepID=A0A225D7Q8_9BACT|nr:baseplate J/gp47 family protein [Fimbriiglobus ruber]OWK37003.1 putative bacteriophage protein [Fimbriiglobus ruber]